MGEAGGGTETKELVEEPLLLMFIYTVRTGEGQFREHPLVFSSSQVMVLTSFSEQMPTKCGKEV